MGTRSVEVIEPFSWFSIAHGGLRAQLIPTICDSLTYLPITRTPVVCLWWGHFRFVRDRPGLGASFPVVGRRRADTPAFSDSFRACSNR
jgi:hypothetical protein